MVVLVLQWHEIIKLRTKIKGWAKFVKKIRFFQRQGEKKQNRCQNSSEGSTLENLLKS